RARAWARGSAGRNWLAGRRGGTDMFRRRVTRMGLLALAGLGFLLVGGPAGVPFLQETRGEGHGYQAQRILVQLRPLTIQAAPPVFLAGVPGSDHPRAI